jgi:hypothetical protein
MLKVETASSRRNSELFLMCGRCFEVGVKDDDTATVNLHRQHAKLFPLPNMADLTHC